MRAYYRYTLIVDHTQMCRYLRTANNYKSQFHNTFERLAVNNTRVKMFQTLETHYCRSWSCFSVLIEYIDTVFGTVVDIVRIQ